MRLTLVNADLPSFKPIPPLGLLCIAKTATCAGHKVKLIDYQLSPAIGSRDPNIFASFCRTQDDVIGVSTSCMALPLVIAALKRLKEKRPKLVTVLGGIGAAGVGEQIIEQFPWIDYVCRGEGEECFRELLECIENESDTSLVGGFICRYNDKPKINPRPRRIKNLSQTEVNAWDYLDLTRYSVINIMTARGCPYPCTFCDIAPYWQRCYRVRSIDAVVSEIRAIQKRFSASSTFVFVDDTLTIDRHRVEMLCKQLGTLQYDIQWSCYARADNLDDDILNLMAKSGCKKVYLGLESGSDSVLNEIQKGFTSEIGCRAAIMARKHISIVQTSFVWGFPFETWKDFNETLLLMAYLVANDISVKANVLTPLPFSTIYHKYSDSLCFMSDYSPQLHLAGYESYKELLNLIEMHPKTFPFFYLYYSDTLKQKYDLLRKMGLSPEHIWHIWELVKSPIPLRDTSSILADFS